MREWTRVWNILVGFVVAPVLSSAVLAQTPASAPAPAPAPPDTREAALEERLRKLEAMNQKILQQYEAMEKPAVRGDGEAAQRALRATLARVQVTPGPGDSPSRGGRG
jgi:hypothetical protein